MLFRYFKRYDIVTSLHSVLIAFSAKLLTRDPNRRLGSGKEDAEEIKRQPFFKDVNWDDVFNKRIPPPYFPSIVRLNTFITLDSIANCRP